MNTNAFSQAIRYMTSADVEADSAIRAHADDLRSRFGKIDVKVADDDRAEFVNYVDVTRVSVGLEAALEILEGYRKAGLRPALYALAILQVTRRGGRFDLSEELLLEASETYYRDDYIRHQYLLAALANGNLSRVKVGLQLLALRDLKKLQTNDRLRFAELASIVGAWDIAALLVTDLEELNPAGSLTTQLLHHRIQKARAFERPSNSEVPAYLINLVEDSRKRSLAEQLFGQIGIKPIRHDAVNGRSLSPFVTRRVLSPDVNRTEFGDGAIGCALSHIAAWEQFLDSGAEAALILEDDAAPYSWQSVDRIAGMSTADITYVNDRMSHIHKGVVGEPISPLWDVLERWPDGRQGWGLDGYILRRSGAEKLVAAFESDGITGHIDGQVGAYGVQSGSQASSHAQKIGSKIRKTLGSDISITSDALNFPITFQLNFGQSSIRAISSQAGAS